jgi:CheY-like chemotaxis protein
MINHKSILLIDDDEDDRFFFVDVLKEFAPGIRCTVARNGLEAIHRLQSADDLPSLIFLDLNMPVMNGFECLSVLKNEGRYKEIPVILYSTSGDPATIRKGHQMGADAFFRKPSDFSAMQTQLMELLVRWIHPLPFADKSCPG